MKIMICASMTFANKIVETKKELEKLGHDVIIPCDTEVHLKDSKFIDDLDADYEHCVQNKVMDKCFNLLAESDAILVLNYPKNNINGYVGTSTLMEIGLARYLSKKIFILHELPNSYDARWAHEVKVMQPIILEGDFSKLK